MITGRRQAIGRETGEEGMTVGAAARQRPKARRWRASARKWQRLAHPAAAPRSKPEEGQVASLGWRPRPRGVGGSAEPRLRNDPTGHLKATQTGCRAHRASRPSAAAAHDWGRDHLHGPDPGNCPSFVQARRCATPGGCSMRVATAGISRSTIDSGHAFYLGPAG